MATIPSGTKFLGVDPAFTDLTERKGSKVDRKSEYFTLEDITDAVGTGSQGPQGVQGPAGPPGPVGPTGLEWQGAWDTDSSYAEDDAVGFNGASWFCISDVTGTGNSNPEEDTTHWALLAAQGAQGIQGIQGPTGPQGPSASSNYTSYKAFITQSGTSNPVINTTSINTTGKTFTITRVGTGQYEITPNTNFSNFKKVFVNLEIQSGAKGIGVTNQKITINTSEYDGTPFDLIDYSYLSIEIYS